MSVKSVCIAFILSTCLCGHASAQLNLGDVLKAVSKAAAEAKPAEQTANTNINQAQSASGLPNTVGELVQRGGKILSRSEVIDLAGQGIEWSGVNSSGNVAYTRYSPDQQFALAVRDSSGKASGAEGRWVVDGEGRLCVIPNGSRDPVCSFVARAKDQYFVTSSSEHSSKLSPRTIVPRRVAPAVPSDARQVDLSKMYPKQIDDMAARWRTIETANAACKGERWLGIEDVTHCGGMFLAFCAKSTASNKTLLGCPADIVELPLVYLGLDRSDNKWKSVQQQAEKEGLLGNAITNKDVDSKISYVLKLCNALFPNHTSSSAEVNRALLCSSDLISATLAQPASTYNMKLRNGVHACAHPAVPKPTQTYCVDAISKSMGELFDRLSPMHDRLLFAEQESYLVKASPQVKAKLDETMSTAGTSIASINALCDKYAEVIGGDVKEYAKTCKMYAKRALDRKTNGQASRDYAAAEETEMMVAMYAAFGNVSMCHAQRKEFQLQYITDGQLAEAKKRLSNLEASATKLGADLAAAKKKADSKLGAGQRMASVSNANFDPATKKHCGEMLGALALFGG